MKKKQFIAAVSSTALGSVMAHGAVLYSGQVNVNLPYTATPPQSSAFDMNGDGIGDFFHRHPTGFERKGWSFLFAPATRQG